MPTPSPARPKSPAREGIRITLLCMLVSVCGLWIVYQLADRALLAGLRSHLEDLASLTASQMDAAAHTALAEAAVPGSPAYEQASAPLLRLRAQVPDIYYAYTLVMRSGQPVFVLDSSYYVENQGDTSEIAMPGEIYAEAPEALLAAWASGRSVACEVPYSDKWGTFLSAFAPLRDPRGQLAGIVGVDISMSQLAARRKPVLLALLAASAACLAGSALIGLWRARSHARLLLREAELLEARAKAMRGERSARAGEHTKSVFLATMSHEIRTPLNGVLGMAEVLAQGPLNDEQHEQIQAIRSSGNLLLVMLNDILDFSKIDAESMVVHLAPVDVAALVENAVALHRASAAKKGLELTVEVATGAPRRVLADPIRTSQILGNLLSNAVKFTKQGSIRVMIGEAAAGMAEVWVEDTGIGIPREHLDHLFVPFSQVDTALNRVTSGTGLGLAISRRLAELMGGSLTAESTAGNGSIFRLSLPTTDQAPAEPASPPEAEALAPIPSGLQVLVAEDIAINRKVVGLLLERLGLSPRFAEDGAAAVLKWQEHQPDVILMDVQMPHVDGLDATRQIRSVSGEATRPWIIALTGGVMGNDREAAARAGMNDFLAKPIDLTSLTAAMARVPTERPS